jgi:acyl-CoA synthetase (AMP-forming)/AMP-acid ligase II
MNRLFDLFLNNKNLILINDQDGSEHKLTEVPLIELNNIQRSLSFAYLDNSFESVIIYLSLINSKHTVTLLPLNLSIEFKKSIEKIYQPNIIFDKSRPFVNGYSTYNSFYSNSYFLKNKFSNYKIHPEIKMLLSTSGTTGSPKFVKLTENSLIENAISIINYLPINSSDVTPLNLPIYYSYGLSVLNTNLIKGGKIFCTNIDLLHPKFWKYFDQYGFTNFAGVPFVYEMLNRIGFTKNSYSSLRYFSQAGGKLNSNLVIKFSEYAEKMKILFFIMYGATEATARMSYLPPSSLKAKIGSIGLPILNGEFKINQETSELLYKGPNVFKGYSISTADLGHLDSINWLETGDLARIDDEGFYYIIGRVKRIVKLFGARINLDEIEQILYINFNFPFYAIGIEDKYMLIMYKNNEIDAELVKIYLLKEFKIHQTVLLVKQIEEVPLNANSKIDYGALKELYGN